MVDAEDAMQEQGARVKRCSQDGCGNHVRQGGVCLKHGAREVSSMEGKKETQIPQPKRVRQTSRTYKAVAVSSMGR